MHQDHTTNEMEHDRERIARKAYELFEQRGGAAGHEVDDWLEAERLISEEMKRHKTRPNFVGRLSGRAKT
jgi:hypothetical protein